MRIRNILIIFIMAASTVLMLTENIYAAPTVPQFASGAGREIDRQVAARLGLADGINGFTLFITTPANIDNLDEANTLARQMQEELARWFSQKGYSVQEIRKSEALSFDPENGELLLSRDTDRLGSVKADAMAVLAGTYTVTPKNVRFNLKLVHTASNEVLGMSTVSIPVTSEIAGLIHKPQGMGGIPMEPTVVTRLP